MINPNNITEKLAEVIQAAYSKTLELKNSQIDPLHVLWSLLSTKNTMAMSVWEKAELDINSVLITTDAELIKLAVVEQDAQPALSIETQKILKNAEDEKADMKDEFLSVEHLLISLLKNSKIAQDILAKDNFDLNKLLILTNSMAYSIPYMHP